MSGPKIAIVYYSMYGHIRTMATAVKKGIEAAGGTATMLQVAETLPAEVLSKMGAPPKSDDPVVDAASLTDYDGIIFGIPGRFGTFPAQFKAFWDSTGGLWQGGKLVGKPAGVFASVGTQGGGQETIGLTMVTQFTHHGMVFVPLGYQDPKVFSYEEVHGATPYGAGTFAGADGSRKPTQLELDVAETQGKTFCGIAAKLK
eukprot:CAMPEP_0174928282 /NCGR_PEP_ID=MMETSP1355-20121228/22833_1 /TAXON_ID=464990 /ORGANISM="Hemiselmis tepida, Strain CCMP443" /LENGTH=200 /DNA_ID=CAMNT_0016174435 /DNA_START=81 /DNA_END=683 /DNA_ORIENTATION=-